MLKSCNSKQKNHYYNLSHGSKYILDLLDPVGLILSRQTQVQLLTALLFLFYCFFSAIEAVDYMIRVLRFYSVGHPITEICDVYQ